MAKDVWCDRRRSWRQIAQCLGCCVYDQGWGSSWVATCRTLQPRTRSRFSPTTAPRIRRRKTTRNGLYAQQRRNITETRELPCKKVPTLHYSVHTLLNWVSLYINCLQLNYKPQVRLEAVNTGGFHCTFAASSVRLTFNLDFSLCLIIFSGITIL